ncbi:Transcription termination factor [Forsythia ovata]|uniref:Transcription termination factor n=1 Tax=Forsythia ovata TaxID=205694 RepID=A0ABD1PMH7_9LAMI
MIKHSRSIGGLVDEFGLRDLLKLSRLRFFNLYVKPYPECVKIYGRFRGVKFETGIQLECVSFSNHKVSRVSLKPVEQIPACEVECFLYLSFNDSIIECSEIDRYPLEEYYLKKSFALY